MCDNVLCPIQYLSIVYFYNMNLKAAIHLSHHMFNSVFLTATDAQSSRYFSPFKQVTTTRQDFM